MQGRELQGRAGKGKKGNCRERTEWNGTGQDGDGTGRRRKKEGRREGRRYGRREGRKYGRREGRNAGGEEKRKTKERREEP